MITFKPIEISDKAIIDSYLSLINYRNCDFAFASLFCWQTKYETSFAIVDDFFVIKYLCDDGLPCFMMPIGTGNLTNVLLMIIDEANRLQIRFRIHAVTSDMFNILDTALPNRFYFQEVRDYFEYVYLRDDLVNLSGKKYQPKRNHINQFKKNHPNYRTQHIKKENIADCRAIYFKWFEDHNTSHDDEDLSDETISVMSALDNYEKLNLSGLILYVNDIPIAFSYGEALTEDTFVVHAEKALTDIQGAYTLINQEFSKQIAIGYHYINREEDLGIESLRKAKMSYYPYTMLRRGSVSLKE
jgi:uncharacterized protein